MSRWRRERRQILASAAYRSISEAGRLSRAAAMIMFCKPENQCIRVCAIYIYMYIYIMGIRFAKALVQGSAAAVLRTFDT